MRYLLATAVTLALLTPATAQAGWKIDRATAIANIVWHPAHCPVGFSLHVQAPPEAVQAAVGPHGVAAGWVEVAEGEQTCDLYLPTEASTWSFDRVCHVAVHEGGHGVGLGHSDRKGSVMFPTIPPFRAQPASSHKWGADSRCRQRGRPYLVAHGIIQAGTTR